MTTRQSKAPASAPSVTFRVVPPVDSNPDAGQLPSQPTPIIGRDAEVSTLVRMLSTDGVRLITLTGPGGVGKTRLACEVAGAVGDFFDAIQYVDLTVVATQDDILPAIASSLGIPDITTHSGMPRLRDALQEQRVLVVLDNFEHLVAAGFRIAELLTSCATLRLLVTSRVVLRLRWEHVFQVAPLSVPGVDRLPPVESLARVPSVALFIERSRSHNAEFALTPANSRAIATICQRLEGLPLALELAAIHMRRLSPEGLLGRLEQPLDVLVHGPRDLPPRQQSLRAALDASYVLLDESQQRLARHLGVFHGGAPLAAVEMVASELGSTPAGAILDGLEVLAEHSIIQIHEPAPGELRFTMLDTIRQYLCEHLRTCGEAELAQERFVALSTAFVNDLPAEAGRFGSGDVLRRLERNDANLQAVLQWSLEQHRPEIGLAIAPKLWRYWNLMGRVTTGRFWLTELLREQPEAVPFVSRFSGLAAAGYLAARSGEYQQAAIPLEEALAIADASIGPAERAELLAELGHVWVSQGMYDDAATLLNEAFALLDGDDVPLMRARALSVSAHLALEREQFDIARDLLGEGYALVAGMSIEGVVDVLFQRAELAMLTGDSMRAQEGFEEALTVARGERYRAAESRALIGLADIAVTQYRPEDARCAYREALLLFEADSSWDRLIRVLEGTTALAAVTNRIDGLDWLVGQAELVRQKTGAAPSTLRRVWVERRLSGMRQTGERTISAMARPLKVSESFDEIVRQLLYVLDHLPPTFSNRHLDLGARGGTAVLSSREREVARYISDGFTNRQIAANLRIAERTVDSHVGNILRKLELSSRTQIAAWEIRQALVPSQEPSFPDPSGSACSPS